MDVDFYLSQIEEILSFAKCSERTIISYKTYTRPFLVYCSNILHKEPENVSYSEIRNFLTTLQKERSLSDASLNHAISEIRFLYEAVLGQTWNPKQVPARKVSHPLPFVPDRQTVQEFISTIDDIKKKAMISLLYSAGLRIHEVCRLKCSDIDHGKGRIYVSPGKNRRDRYAILTENTYQLLCSYWRSLPPHLKTRDWLFTQQTDIKKPAYTQFISSFIPKHEDALGWEHRLSAHSFRHAYATHSYQDGMDILTLSRLLGHTSLNSTTIYVHLADVCSGSHRSPMEGMVIE